MPAKPEPEVESNRVRSVVVILNPASGRGAGRRMRPELERLLEEASKNNSRPWSVVETTAPGSGAAQARQAAEDGADVVAAAGGDGTYGEVANGLVGTGAVLGIVPLGTGNDFARGLGLNTGLERSVRTLFDGVPKPVDLGRCGDRYFINVAGCGFDAVVAQRVNRGYRRLRGTAAYIAAVYQSLIAFRPAAMRITLDGETREMRAMLCTVANSQTYGGGMRIAPDAQIDDGLFDVCILGDASRLEFIRAFPRVFKGTHTTHPKVLMARAQAVRVECETPLPVLIDGEVLGATPAEFTICHHAIRVMTPITS